MHTAGQQLKRLIVLAGNCIFSASHMIPKHTCRYLGIVLLALSGCVPGTLISSAGGQGASGGDPASKITIGSDIAGDPSETGSPQASSPGEIIDGPHATNDLERIPKPSKSF